MAGVLVIGGTLFIGRRLVDKLLAQGDDVTIMHRGSSRPFGDRVAEIKCDRNDTAAVERALHDHTFEVIYDNVYDWQRGTTGEQVATAASAARDLRRYVFTSSVAVYAEDGEFDEDGELVPSDSPNTYGAQKADSERALFRLHREQNVPVTTLRPAFIYGPRNPFDRESFFWDRILADRPVLVPGDGTNTMQFVHVDDVAQAAMLAAGNDRAIGRAYNLGNFPAISQRDWIELLARVAGKTVRLVHVPRDELHRAGGGLMAPPLYFGEYLDLPPKTARNERVQRELGLQLRSLESGFAETFEWYRQQKRAALDFTWEDRIAAGWS